MKVVWYTIIDFISVSGDNETTDTGRFCWIIGTNGEGLQWIDLVKCIH